MTAFITKRLSWERRFESLLVDLLKEKTPDNLEIFLDTGPITVEFLKLLDIIARANSDPGVIRKIYIPPHLEKYVKKGAK